MANRFTGTLLTKLRPQIDKPEDAGKVFTRMSEETDKALLDLLKKVNETSASAADAASVNSSLTAIDASMIAAIKGMKYGLEVSYVSADVLSISPGAVEINGEIVSVDAPLAITASMTNFPAAGAWAFVTMEKGGAHRLFPATGAGTVRPSDNCFQLTGGGVGFDDINKQGYYLDPDRRIIDAIHRVNATTWYTIKLGAGIIESGGNSLGFYKKTENRDLIQSGRASITPGLGVYPLVFPIPYNVNDYSIATGVENGTAPSDIYVFMYNHAVTGISLYLRGAGWAGQSNIVNWHTDGR